MDLRHIFQPFRKIEEFACFLPLATTLTNFSRVLAIWQAGMPFVPYPRGLLEGSQQQGNTVHVILKPWNRILGQEA